VTYVDVSYDPRADVLAVRARGGEPKYVLVVRGTFVIFADDKGIWGIGLDAESWDVDPIKLFIKLKIEMSYQTRMYMPPPEHHLD
jgi:hypothetical protein